MRSDADVDALRSALAEMTARAEKAERAEARAGWRTVDWLREALRLYIERGAPEDPSLGNVCPAKDIHAILEAVGMHPDQRRAEAERDALRAAEEEREYKPGSPAAMAPYWYCVEIVERVCDNKAGEVFSSIEQILGATIEHARAQDRARLAAVEAGHADAVEERDRIKSTAAEYLDAQEREENAWPEARDPSSVSDARARLDALLGRGGVGG